MTAHTHPGLFSRPSLFPFAQEALMGSREDIVRVLLLADAHWTECQPCIDRSVADVAASPGALLVLRRVCTLQDSGKVRWPHGSAEADEEVARLEETDLALRTKLVAAGAIMWTSRARIVDEMQTLVESAFGKQ